VNNIYPGTSAAGALIGAQDGYIQPGAYGVASHPKADMKTAPSAMAPSSAKVAAALAWESSRSMNRPDFKVAGVVPGRGHISPVGSNSGYYSGASQGQYGNDYPQPPPPPQQQLPTVHSRMPHGPMGPARPMGASHDYGQFIQPSGLMLPMDQHIAPSQAVGSRGYYNNGPGMVNSVGSNNTWAVAHTNDMNRGMYGMGKQSQPTQYRHFNN